MNENLFRGINIDSLTLRLPLEYVKVLDLTLTDEFIDYSVNRESGEMFPIRHKYKPSEFKSLSVNQIGYYTEFKVKSLYCQTTRTLKKYLYILLKAKILESRYFDGINSNNTQHIYNQLIDYKIVTFSYDDFLNKSMCTSIDFCKNFRAIGLVEQLKELSTTVSKYAKLRPKSKLTTNIKEQSFRFTPKNDTSNAQPHIFIYNKEKELFQNSSVFTNAHLHNYDLENLCRAEFRIKDEKHAKHLGLSDNSFKTLTSLSDEEKEDIFHKMTNCYLHQHLDPVIDQKLNPTKQIFFNMLNYLIGAGMNFQLASEIILKDLPRNRKSEKLKELKNIYSYIVNDVNDNNNDIYNVLNLYHHSTS